MPVILSRRHIWLLMIPVLLLAAGLAARHLDTHAFATDEVASMFVARGPFYQQLNPVEVWNRVAARSPDQALGLALILSNWGGVFGWSEVSTRALAFFAGLLALALIYRLGSDLFSPLSGLVAVLLLSTTVFFVTYMHIVRVFTLVALVATLTLWSYWRIVIVDKPPHPVHYLGLFAGSLGLFYTHYFATPLLAVLGLYHLLFAAKNARWWRVGAVVALAGLLFLPELSVFVAGLQRNLGNTNLHENAMTIPQTLSRLVYFLSNGLLLLDEPVPLALVAVAGTVTVYRLRPRQLPVMWQANRNLTLIVFLTLSLLLVILVANEWLQAMSPQRIRYTMALWPLMALLAGYGLWRLWCSGHHYVTAALVAGWVLVGLWANLMTDIRYELDAFTREPLHHIHDELVEQATESGLLVVNGFWSGNGRPRDYYTTYDIETPRMLVYHDNPELMAALDQSIDEALTVWLLAEGRDSQNYDMLEASLREDFVHCHTSADEEELVLSLYARTESFCDPGAPVIEFGESISLTNLAPVTVDGDQVQVDMIWQVEPEVPPDIYSVGLYIMDADSDEIVSQADYGLPDTMFGPARSVFDVSQLDEGRYEILTSVYDWATVTPLPGVDLRSDMQGTALLLDTFVID